MTNVRNFLDISTGHLTQKTRDLLDAGCGPSALFPHPDGYGWILYVCEDEIRQEWLKKVGEEHQCLLDCMERADELNCDYILFDCDAEIDDGLLYYDED